MKRLTVLTVFAVLIMAVTAHFAYAQPGSGKRGKHHGEGLKQLEIWKDELNLTDAQYDQLKDMMVENEKEAIELRSQMEVLRLELEEIMTEDKPNKTEALKKVDELGTVRTKLQKLRVGLRIDMKNVLTDEQIDKLQELRAERRQDRWDNRGNRSRSGKGRHGPPSMDK